MINYRAKLDKLNNKEDDIRKSKIELQKQLLKAIRYHKNMNNKQVCDYVGVAYGNFSKYYGGKNLFIDSTLYKLIDLWECEEDE